MPEDIRKEYIIGLREMAAFFESRPDLPLPAPLYICIWEKSTDTAHDRALQMAPCEKVYIGDEYFELRRKFGPHDFMVTWARDQVCERKQVGIETVPERIIPAYEVPIYEWDCSAKPLLSSKQNQKD